MSLCIESTLLISIEETALASMPQECCGLLIGRVDGGDQLVERAVTLDNVAHADRTRRYEVDPQVVFDAHRDARNEGEQILGFFHSHPDGSYSPSNADVRAAWPGKSYLIVGLDSVGVVAVRSWRLAENGSTMDAEPIALTDAGRMH